MKKAPQPEYSDITIDHFFDPADSGPLSRVLDSSLAPRWEAETEAALDRFLAAIKFIFLYIPGAAFIHLVIMPLALFAFYTDRAPDILAGMFGASVIGAFMIMLGIGKLSDLKYLRVVGVILASATLFSIAFAIVASLMSGDLFGGFFLMTLPITLVNGFLVKRYLDRLPNAE